MAGGRSLESLCDDVEPRRIGPRPADDLESEIAQGGLAEFLGEHVAVVDVLAGAVELTDHSAPVPEEVDADASAVAQHEGMLERGTWQSALCNPYAGQRFPGLSLRASRNGTIAAARAIPLRWRADAKVTGIRSRVSG
ncbi:hypothetical protein [Rhodococcus sp. O3]|uniref:hypothetical protein n=1 Tax=Rhodococcus sp. O3 TaxID=3404919 RepID=UPI003B68335C